MNEMVNALCRELELRQSYLDNEAVETIYFGGGTPSLLPVAAVNRLLDRVRSLYTVQPATEVTLEANPDDLNEELAIHWQEAGINRLSIGVQSFHEVALRGMNRAHNADQAIASLTIAKKHFSNFSADLIYGIPGMTNEAWKENVDKMIALQVPHLSCYALTVEPKTPLDKLIREKKYEAVKDDQQSEQFLLLMEWLKKAGYEHYEISNFALPGLRSRHNSSYWRGKAYLGIGPSAHSYNGNDRQYNVANNRQYIDAIENGRLPLTEEKLSETQKTNEYLMTSIRTIEGIDLARFNHSQKEQILESAIKFVRDGKIVQQNNRLVLSDEGKLFADGIASDLFFN